MTVLKNEKSVLPLDGKSLKTIAVIGTQAATPAVHGGGSGQVFPYYISDPLSAIRERFAGAANCSTAGGGEHCVLYDDGRDMESVAATCKQADVVRRPPFRSHFHTARSFDQDRLGTNLGKSRPRRGVVCRGLCS